MSFFNKLLVNSHDGNYNEIVNVVSKYFCQFVNSEIIIQNISKNKCNVIVKWGAPELLINAHLDTVKPSEGWLTDPYELVEKDEYYFGLGTCDTKGNIFAISEALTKVIPNNLMLLFSVDEESNGIESGVTHFIESDYIKTIKRVIVCEPTNNLIANSHKGYYSFFIKSNAVSRHSSESEYLSDNAIYKISKYFKCLINEGYNLGTIHGGLAGNIIAPDCCSQISIRSNDDFDNVLNNLKIILGNELIIEPKTILPSLKNGIKSADSIPLEFWTEASLFKNHGIDSFIYGIGDISNAHKPNESVSKESLEKGIIYFIDEITKENER